MFPPKQTPVQPLRGEIPLVNRGVLGARWPPAHCLHEAIVPGYGQLVCPCLGAAFSLGVHLLRRTLMTENDMAGQVFTIVSKDTQLRPLSSFRLKEF